MKKTEKKTRHNEIKEGATQMTNKTTMGEAFSSLDIEDVREQGFNNEIDQEKIHSKTSDDRYEFGEEILGPNPQKGLKNLRDIDVDGLGKDKSKLGFSFFGRKK